MTTRTPFLDALRAGWQAKGWPLDTLELFRMEANGNGNGGDGGGGENTGGNPAGGTSSSGSTTDLGFPPDTPLAEMSLEQQVAYWKHQSRKHEATVKARHDYDALKAKAQELDEIKAANATEQERAIAAARQEAETEARRAMAPALVRAEFRAEAKGVLTTEQLDALLEDLDLTKYLTDNGEVDSARVAAKVQALAPAGRQEDDTGRMPGTGSQGRRSDPPPARGVAAGREMFQARRAARTGNPS